MAEKDVAEKLLLDYDDVFADIINVLLFNGEEVVKDGSLSFAGTKSQYKADTSKLHEQERDIAKFWEYGGKVRFAFLGLENQTNIDCKMPLRVISYDGATYRSQLSKENDEYPLYPVITLVLYFGTKTSWNRPRSLCECFEIPEILKPYVNDYKINVIEIAWLDDETVRKFKSDFRHVVDYHVQMRRDNNYVPSKDELKHVSEIFQVMRVLTDDDRFAEAINSPFHNKEATSMCEFLDRIEARGEARGKAIGEARGEAKGKWSVIEEMLKNKLAVPLISACSKISVDEILAFAKAHGYAPVMR